MIIKQALEILISEAESERDTVAIAILKSFEEYVDNGGLLSELSWFNGLNFKEIEVMDRHTAVNAA